MWLYTIREKLAAVFRVWLDKPPQISLAFVSISFFLKKKFYIFFLSPLSTTQPPTPKSEWLDWFIFSLPFFNDESKSFLADVWNWKWIPTFSGLGSNKISLDGLTGWPLSLWTLYIYATQTARPPVSESKNQIFLRWWQHTKSKAQMAIASEPFSMAICPRIFFAQLHQSAGTSTVFWIDHQLSFGNLPEIVTE